jgi:outer membrane receptor for ferric coprogen and ferric-rhodotorulic acid
VAATLLCAPARAQTAPAPRTPASGTGEAPIALSPFEVRPEEDSGYQAANTTSGSRLNAKLKDTPAAVSPFTKEFLSDIGATDLESMLAYATNVEREVEDSSNGFNNPPGRDSTGNDFRFRVRGVAGSSSVNYAQSAVPVDLYNIERAEIASGPNSILFGLGAPGGTVALSSKFAQLRRNATSAKSVVGSWDYFRHEVDHNQVLIRGQLGLRLLGLYQDAKGWRKWDLNEQRRLTAAFSYQPWARTAIRGSYQGGDSANNISLPWNATNSVTSWLDAGRPVARITPRADAPSRFGGILLRVALAGHLELSAQSAQHLEGATFAQRLACALLDPRLRILRPPEFSGRQTL